jgi:hypothetical protein
MPEPAHLRDTIPEYPQVLHSRYRITWKYKPFWNSVKKPTGEALHGYYAEHHLRHQQ